MRESSSGCYDDYDDVTTCMLTEVCLPLLLLLLPLNGSFSE